MQVLQEWFMWFKSLYVLFQCGKAPDAQSPREVPPGDRDTGKIGAQHAAHTPIDVWLLRWTGRRG